MIRPNAWNISVFLESVETYTTKGDISDLKDKFDNDERIYAWAKRDRTVYLLTDNKDVIEQYSTLSIDFDSLVAGLQQQLIFYFIDSCFKKNGFQKRSRNVFFLPLSRDKFSMTQSVKGGQFYIHFGFKFTLKRAKGGLLLLIDPERSITEDGESYSPDYSKEKNSELFESSSNSFDYSARLTSFTHFKKIFGINFKLELNKDSFIECKLFRDIETEIRVIEEPTVDFGNKKTEVWPQLGLNKYGPLDYNESHLNRPKKVELALISRSERKIASQRKKSYELLDKLNGGLKQGKYPYKGFQSIYNSSLIMGQERYKGITEDEIDSVSSPEDIVNILLGKALEIKNAGTSFDICIIELVPEWKEFFEYNNIDLHDLIKANFSNENIKTQIITNNSEDNISKETLENLALGIYYKSGGTPWRLNTSFSDVAYIGISFGFQKSSKRRLIGFAELFDCYGQFIAMRSIGIKEISEGERFNRSRDCHLTKKQFVKIIDSLLQDYGSFLDGNHPNNLIIHKTTYFNTNEREVISHYSDYPFGLSLAYLQQNHNWHLIQNKEPVRGSFWEIKDKLALLYTTGSVNGRYFQLGSPLPYLVELIYSDNLSLFDICKQLVELTKLNFNSNRTYSKDPVTLLHSRKIINLLRVGMHENRIPKDPRYFL